MRLERRSSAPVWHARCTSQHHTGPSSGFKGNAADSTTHLRRRTARRFFLPEAEMNARSRLLVVGNGMVGQRFLESIPADAPFDITVLGEEPRPAYDRVQLSAFFSGKTADDLSLVEAGFFTKNNIALRLSERAVSIERGAHTVRTSN